MHYRVIEVRTVSKLTVVRFTRECSTMTDVDSMRWDLSRLARRLPCHKMVVRLTAFNPISILALVALSTFRQMMTEGGGEMVVSEISPKAAAIFKRTGFDRVLGIQGMALEAIASL